MAGADANYQFIFVDIGSKGRFRDAYIFENSAFGKSLLAGKLGVPEPAPLYDGEEPFPYVLIGDLAFPLSEKLLKPYSETQTCDNIEN